MEQQYKHYQRKGLSEMRPYVSGEDMTGISISDPDKQLPTLDGGMIARNPKDHNDKWYVAKKYFEDNLELAPLFSVSAPTTNPTYTVSDKTFGNTDSAQEKNNIPDVEYFGECDLWKLLSKASSKKQSWMKGSKAMEIPNIGCIVQVTTQQKDNVAEAVVFVPDVKIEETKDEAGKVTGRKLIATKM